MENKPDQKTAKITVTQEFLEEASNSHINSLLDLLLNFKIKSIKKKNNRNYSTIIIEGENLPDSTSLRVKFGEKEDGKIDAQLTK